MSIRVVLADDHKILVDSLSLLLGTEKDITVVGVACDGQTVLRLVASLRPDVVVMDIGMPGTNGIDATRRLVGVYPGIKVIALSSFRHKQYVLEMLEAGASAYILKENAYSELVQALRTVMKGKRYLCKEITAVMDAAEYLAGEGVPQLSQRERRVLQLLADGSTSSQIAEQLFISTGTVDVHRRNIMRKLDLHSIAELTKYAIRLGLTEC